MTVEQGQSCSARRPATCVAQQCITVHVGITDHAACHAKEFAEQTLHKMHKSLHHVTSTALL